MNSNVHDSYSQQGYINEHTDNLEKMNNNHAHVKQSVPDYMLNTHSSLSSREVGVFNKVGTNGVNVEYKVSID